MSGFYDDMPSLVDPGPSRYSRPPTPYIPSPEDDSISEFHHTHEDYPTAHSLGGHGPWADPGWAHSTEQTMAEYPSHHLSSAPLWPMQPQGWYPMANKPYPHWSFNTSPPSDSWSTPSSFGANPATAQGISYPSHPYYFSAPPFGANPYPAPLTRSISRYSPSGAPASSSHHIKRSASTGPSDRSLSRRPRSWRPDYKVRTGISAILPRKRRSLSTERAFYDNTRRVLHEFLQYSTFNPPASLDLRDDPMSIKFFRLNRPFNRQDLLQYACDPPAPFMRLYHDKLPWYIDIYARNPYGVTIHDLFDQMHDALMIQIHKEDYYNDELDDQDRAKLANAFKDRCGGDPDQISKGIRRVDFLKGRVAFEGIVRGRDGLWEIKSKKR